MKALICILFFLSFLNCRSEAQTGQSQNDWKCESCHICKKPSFANPCLRPCPRHFGKNQQAMESDEGPNVITLNELEKVYEAVVFSHKLHAHMTELGDGCVSCHHYTPTDQSHPPCKECHDPKVASASLEKPGLKGAYHRQCMGCHQEWSSEQDCEICHAMKEKKKKQGSEYVVHAYRPCSEPDQKLYKTSHQNGDFVTFFHNNHSKLYGLSCRDCHQEEACIRCHYQGKKPVSVVKASADLMHHKCSACHNISAEKGCSKCHSKFERKRFDHKVASGWPLTGKHRKLSCQACHPSGKRITKLSRNCNGCHASWNSKNFSHAVTGLALDENHRDNDCQDCHANRGFTKVGCENCHDDMSYPKDLPGTRVKKK